MTIVNRLPELAAEKFGGKDKINMQRMQIETRLSYSTVYRWMKNHIDRIDAPILNTWCKYFNCGPGDILAYIPDEPVEES